MSADDDGVFVFVGTYSDTQSAQADYELVKQLHSDGVIGTYDAAVVNKDEQGKVHIHMHEKPTEYGAWTGLVVGALLGILFPPTIFVAPAAGVATGVAGGAVGAGAGGLIGHLWRGMSRSDVKELGEALDEGEAALVVVGQEKLEEKLKKELKGAVRAYEKQIDADAAELRKELEKAIDELTA
jgi:uncharacterized membrane protein